MQKHLLLCFVALFCANTLIAQDSKVQSLHIVPAGELYGWRIESPTGMASNLTFTFPNLGGTVLVTPSSGVSTAWLLGGNDVSSTPTLNQIGTTTGQDLQLIAGVGPNVRMTLSNSAAAVTVNNGGELRIEEASPGTDYSSFKAGTQSGNLNYTLPVTAPTTNQVLTASAVSGSDVTLSWSNASVTSTTVGVFDILTGDVTFDPVPGLSVSVAANTTYEVIGRINVDEVSASANTLNIRFVGPAGAFLFVQVFQSIGGTENGYALNSNIPYTADETAVFHGFLVVAGTGGTFQIEAALSGAGGPDDYEIDPGSFLSIKQW